MYVSGVFFLELKTRSLIFSLGMCFFRCFWDLLGYLNGIMTSCFHKKKRSFVGTLDLVSFCLQGSQKIKETLVEMDPAQYLDMKRKFLGGWCLSEKKLLFHTEVIRIKFTSFRKELSQVVRSSFEVELAIKITADQTY